MSQEFREAPDRFFAQQSRIPRDRCLPFLLNARHSPIERLDEFLELAHELGTAHRHVCAPLFTA